MTSNNAAGCFLDGEHTPRRTTLPVIDGLRSNAQGFGEGGGTASNLDRVL